jgi:sugar lactone lactonase YvrE
MGLIVLIAFVLAVVCGWGNPAAAHEPRTRPAEIFASGLTGPEGLAFDNQGNLFVGSTTGEIRRYLRNGLFNVLANVGQSLAGITVTNSGDVLAAAFGSGTVWRISPTGAVSVQASGIAGPNFTVETRSGHILVSASSAGTIVDITGVPIARASGLAFPNGMAIGDDGFLYVAEMFENRVSRLPLHDDGTLGAAEIYAEGLPLADGIAFDRSQNLLVVGFDSLRVVERSTMSVLTMTADAALDWPSNIAFGRGRGFHFREIYLANYGSTFGNGTTIIRLRYNHTGTRLIRGDL